jgi:hypothetical protein
MDGFITNGVSNYEVASDEKTTISRELPPARYTREAIFVNDNDYSKDANSPPPRYTAQTLPQSPRAASPPSSPKS